jgi:Protein of unknown function (DUF2892)
VTTNLAGWERALSLATGIALLWFAARQSRGRLSMAATGAGFIARGLSGYCPVSAAAGRDGREPPRLALRDHADLPAST